MSYDQESKLVRELHRLTRAKTLTWKRMVPPDVLSEGTNTHVFNFFGAKFNDRKLGVFERRTLTYNDDLDRYVWIQKPVLAVFNESWDLQAEIEQPDEVAYLFDSVRLRDADLDSLITEVEKIDTGSDDDE